MTRPPDAPRSGPPDTEPDGDVPTAIVEAIAAEADLDPIELPPLFETVDPEALDAIFSDLPDGTPRPTGEIEFPYAGFRVRVGADQSVSVTPDGDSR